MGLTFKALHRRDLLTQRERKAMRHVRHLTNQMHRYYGKAGNRTKLPYPHAAHRKRVFHNQKILRSFLCNRRCKDVFTESFMVISSRLQYHIYTEKSYIQSTHGEHVYDQDIIEGRRFKRPLQPKRSTYYPRYGENAHWGTMGESQWASHRHSDWKWAN